MKKFLITLIVLIIFYGIMDYISIITNWYHFSTSSVVIGVLGTTLAFHIMRDF